MTRLLDSRGDVDRALEGAAPSAPVAWSIRARTALHVAGLLLILAGPARAAQVYWSAPESLGAGQTGSLDLVFEDTEPTGAVTLPTVDGLRVLGAPAQSSDISIINGQRSASLTLSYPVRAERTGAMHVPAFDVDTPDGPQRVAALDVAVGRAAVRDADGGAVAVEDVVQARLTPSTMSPYAGEVVDLDLRITLAGNRRGQVVGAPAWDAGALGTEPWSDGHVDRTADGAAVRFHTRAIAPQAGRVEVAPAEQAVQLETARGRDPLAGFDPFGSMRRMGAGSLFDSFFGGAQMTEVTARSNAVQLDVRPLPQPAPAGFSGAVGQFTLESTLTPEHPTTGEPVTWTLTLSGTGNWPSGVALPARAVPSDLRTLQPKQRASFGDHGRFSGEVSEDLVIVPNQPGTLALEPVRFVFFNPDSGRYETAEAQPPTLQITGEPLPPPVAAPAPVAAAAAAPEHAASAPAAPSLGAPLPGTGSGFAPLPWSSLRLWLLGPLALAIGARLTRAAWRHWQTHPRRLARRTARAMRAAVVATRDAATTEARLAALLDWQHTAARVLGIDRAAPTAEQLRGIADPAWAEAWAGSERALFARGHALPAEWAAQALALCDPPRPPRRRRPTRPRPLLAKAATATLLALALATPGHGAEPAAAPSDREALRARVDAAPLDWVARHNLGLAEAQAGDSGRALGETVAALAQAPRQAAVRANAQALSAALPEAERALAPLLHGRLASRAAPATWQMILIVGTALVAAAIAVGRRRAAAILAGAGLLLAGSGALALREAGVFADRRAAVIATATALHAVPTDAAPADDAPALAVGSVVRAGREFLGWTQVTRADGAVGWVRRTALVPLYGAAPPAGEVTT